MAAEFSYVRASQVSEALELLNQPGYTSRPLAGNTDLMLLLRNQPDLCNRVVDITLHSRITPHNPCGR